MKLNEELRMRVTPALLMIGLTHAACSNQTSDSRRRQREVTHQSLNDTSLVPRAASTSLGRVMVERWNHLPGNKVSDLTSAQDFPLRPSTRFFLNTLETPRNSQDDYGTRIRGYLRPAESGSYTFYISGDNESQFFLSTSDSPQQLSKTPLAYLTAGEWTENGQWEKFQGQISQATSLEAGKRYYFEVLHKEGRGSDGVSVGWKLPSGALERPIRGNRLSQFELHPEFTSKEPMGAEILNTLAVEHPRLIATHQDFARIKKYMAEDPRIKSIVSSQVGAPPSPLPVVDLNARKKCDLENGTRKVTAEHLLHLPACARVKQDDIRLLDTSREVLRRINTLSLAYQITGDKRFADRAILEMKAVADPKWGDWNPSHFLDTAEMTHALAVGYDWLYSQMRSGDRQLIREAIKTKGLVPGREEFKKGAGWTKSSNNWNIVCNGGLILGALAIAEDEQPIASQILSLAVASSKKSGAFQAFAPDGAYPEGIGYWGYAVKYLASLLAALESGLGTDFGLGKAEGLAEAGRFPMAAIGPRRDPFNYADVGSGAINPSSDMHYLAQKYGRAEYAAFANEFLGGYGLIWYNPDFGKTSDLNVPLDFHFRSVEVVMLRSGTGDTDAYVGLKSGDNKAGHSHLDLGSFVYDAKGVRWGKDLGMESYGPVGKDYFDPVKRWNFYKTRAEGQNTLVINPSLKPGQDPQASATISDFRSSADQSMATTDMTQAYKPYGARSMKRGLKLYKKSQMLMVQDEMSVAASSDIYWFMHTDAALTVKGSTAILTKGDKKLVARILSPAGAKFGLMEAAALPTSPAKPKGESVNSTNRKLAVHLEKVSEAQLTILLIPLDKDETVPADLPSPSKLSDW